MTPSEVNTAARQIYNAVGDDFWSDDEMLFHMYNGCMELARKAFVIERTFTTTSVADQREYSFPTYTISIYRVEYNGQKLAPMTFRDDDVITVLESTSQVAGVPTSYAIFNNTLYVRPLPSSSGVTIKVFAYVQPQPITITSTLEIPLMYHPDLVFYLLAEMNAKNKNYNGAKYYREMWDRKVMEAVKLNAKRKRGDAFAIVQNVDLIPQTDLGNL